MPNSPNKLRGSGYPYKPGYYNIIMRAFFIPFIILVFIILLIQFYTFNKNPAILNPNYSISSYKVSQDFSIFSIQIFHIIGNILYWLSFKLNKINLNSRNLVLNPLNKVLSFYNKLISYRSLFVTNSTISTFY